MAPKQSKQSTLGNFFGGQNGAKAAPQQSKLAFSSKAQPKDEAESKAEAVKNEDAEIAVDVKKSDVDEDMHDAKEEESEATEVKPDVATNGVNGHSENTSSSSPSRKRQASEGAAEAEEDEPPAKRKRLQQGRKNGVKAEEDGGAAKEAPKSSPQVKAEPQTQVETPKDAKHAVKKTGRKSVTFGKDAADEDKASSIKRKATPKKPANDKPVKDEEDGDDMQVDTAKATTPSKPPAKEDETDDDADGKTASEHDDDSELDEAEEDEKPEVKAEARKKVQTTLSSNTKDPYPDWKPGEPVPYAALCTTFSKIEMTTKRLEIAAHCSLFMRQVLRLTPSDLVPVIFLMVGKLAADYTGIELGIGESLIKKAIGETTGRSLQVINADQQEIGDLGLVAAKSRSKQPPMFKPKPLTVRGVHDGLMAIAVTEGNGAQGRKVAGIKKLLSSADADKTGKGGQGIDITKNKGGASESKFIIRTLEGKMRLGLAEKTVIVSLSQAFVFHEVFEKTGKPPSTDQLAKGEAMLKSVYNELPSYEVVVPTMLTHGIFTLHDTCNLRPGVPLKPMLARPTKSITEVLDRFENKDFTCEYKYDGERAQIHFVSHDASESYASATTAPSAGKSERGVSNIFSRNSEDLSKKYPDILARLPSWVKKDTKSFVLDCETVAWDSEAKKVLPFQQLMTRKRKDVKAEDVKVKVCVFAFDLLFLNGEALVNQSLRERRKNLEEAFEPIEGEFQLATSANISSFDSIQSILDASISASCEGLMVKKLDGPESYYEPSRRSQNWLKVKKDYLSGVGDSLDLVVLGAYYGKGKRTSVYGAFLLACWNEERECFESICNLGTGFSEEVLGTLYEELSPLVIERPKPFYEHTSGAGHQPDVWFEARMVWEVKTADLTISPRYRACAGSMGLASGAGEKGVSLRFPRFLRVREDKKPEEATSSKRVRGMYEAQEGVAKGKSGPSADDDFEY